MAGDVASMGGNIYAPAGRGGDSNADFVIGSGDRYWRIRCGRLAVRGLSLAGVHVLRQGAAFARKRANNPLGVAVRSLNLLQRRTPAPVACQRKRA